MEPILSLFLDCQSVKMTFAENPFNKIKDKLYYKNKFSTLVQSKQIREI
jgi:hypothetical protein